MNQPATDRALSSFAHPIKETANVRRKYLQLRQAREAKTRTFIFHARVTTNREAMLHAREHLKVVRWLMRRGEDDVLCAPPDSEIEGVVDLGTGEECRLLQVLEVSFVEEAWVDDSAFRWNLAGRIIREGDDEMIIPAATLSEAHASKANGPP